jgi:hypothetical protein
LRKTKQKEIKMNNKIKKDGGSRVGDRMRICG